MEPGKRLELSPQTFISKKSGDSKPLPAHACAYCGVHEEEAVVQCSAPDCGRWFCNSRGIISASHIVHHLVRSRHKEISLPPANSTGLSTVECYHCGNRNLFMLGFVAYRNEAMVVLLCRDPCLYSHHHGDASWSVSDWVPLVSGRRVLPWLIPEPSEDQLALATPLSAAQLIAIEDSWKLTSQRGGAGAAVGGAPTNGAAQQRAGAGAAAGGAPGSSWADADADADAGGAGAGEDGEAAPPTVPVLPISFTSGGQYVQAYAPLIQLEAECAKEATEARRYGNVTVRWESSAEARRVTAVFSLPSHEESRILPGDELRLCSTEPSRSTVGAGGAAPMEWSSVGIVVRVAQHLGPTTGDDVYLDIRGADAVSAPTDVFERFQVEIIWRATTFERMQEALRIFAHEKGAISSAVMRRLLGQPEDSAATFAANIPASLAVPNLPGLNLSQSSAVKSVLQKPVSLIQGPPGTGKTVTSTAVVYHIIQMARQLAAKETKGRGKESGGRKNRKGRKGGDVELPAARVLVCAPSNVAVDHLAERMAAAGLRVVRVCGKGREAVSAAVDYLTLHGQTRQLASFELQRLLQMRDNSEEMSEADIKRLRNMKRTTEREILNCADVVCTTCVAAADLRLAHMSFPYVLIDEATQAAEPESLIPIVRGCQHLVLVGDHAQLGPVVVSRHAMEAGLGRSLFERLVLLGIRPSRLQVQYRMHPSLSEFPSNAFYEGTLQNGIVVTDRSRRNLSFPWPDSRKPMFFYNSATGEEEYASTGTSFVNRTEGQFVECVVTALLRSGASPNSIGVVTPYDGQRTYILSLLMRATGMPNELYREVEVASVDAFQGREKDYIVMSCVRASDRLGIGFLSDPRRLNVALTRAKCGLIIVGNARVLSRHPLWNALLTHFKEPGLIVEGSLQALRPSPVVLQKPRRLVAEATGFVSGQGPSHPAILQSISLPGMGAGEGASGNPNRYDNGDCGGDAGRSGGSWGNGADEIGYDDL